MVTVIARKQHDYNFAHYVQIFRNDCIHSFLKSLRMINAQSYNITVNSILQLSIVYNYF